MGTAVVAAGVGVGFHLAAVDLKARAEQQHVDDPEFDRLSARFADDRKVALAAYGVGAAALLATGIYLLFEPDEEQVHIEPRVGPGGASLGVSWAW